MEIRWFHISREDESRKIDGRINQVLIISYIAHNETMGNLSVFPSFLVCMDIAKIFHVNMAIKGRTITRRYSVHRCFVLAVSHLS